MEKEINGGRHDLEPAAPVVAPHDGTGGWLPIASAPKDGSWVMGYWFGPGDPEISSMHWHGSSWWDSSDRDESAELMMPTHWMPLLPHPAAPEAK
jgi:hypothetical protein